MTIDELNRKAKPSKLSSNKEFKIALVNPKMFLKSYRFFPIGLGLLSAALEKTQCDYHLYDLHIDWHTTAQFINQIKNGDIPNLFAVTGLLTSFPMVKKLCANIRKNFPESKIVLGGRICVMEPEFIFNNIETDFIIQGEGEVGLIQLVSALENKVNDLSSVEGLSYYDNNGMFCTNGEAEPVKQISEYIIPYHRFDMAKYIKLCNIQSPNVPSINILSSRGCPFSCTFCNNSKGKKKVRLYDANIIFQSIDYMIEKFGLEHVTFNDDIFTVNKQHMHEICNGLLKRHLSYSLSTRLDFLDEDSIRLLDQTGCHYLCIGIESPAPDVAKIIDKRLDLEKYQKNISLLRNTGIVVNYGFMIGYLGETEQTIEQTRNFVLKNKIIYSAFFANAFPNTKLYDMIKHRIDNEEEYLKKLFTVDLSRDYLVNMTNIKTSRLYKLRDELVIDSVLTALNKKLFFPHFLFRIGGLSYLYLMRKFGLNNSFFKTFFEFINMVVIKPMTVGSPSSKTQERDKRHTNQC